MFILKEEVGVGLQSSVGKNGTNAARDVLVVQELLNKRLKSLGQPLLKVDGQMGPNTLEAIARYQRTIVGMAQPDSLITPDGKTWKLLSKDPFLPLPSNGQGYYVYTSQDKVYGTQQTIASVRKLTLALAKSGIEIGVGDMSFENGRAMPPHHSHRNGLDVDIRPQRTDKRRLPISYTGKEYSRTLTSKVVAELKKDPNLKVIYFNDNKILGVVPWSGHDNHLHVRFHH